MEYGLIGEKLGHSYSKIIHELLGFYEYELKEIPKDELDAFMRAKDFKGINVTIPYKQDVMKYLDYIDEGAKTIGAVNAIVNKDGKLYGYNTDYYGLKKLVEYTGTDINGKKVLVLGTGGTSKTAKAVVSDMGASDVIKVGRSHRDDNITYEEACKEHNDAQFIINTTPAGMYPNIGISPIELEPYKKLECLVDVVYNPTRTQVMIDAQKLGIKAYGGLRMLVYQAMAAAELFVDKKISDETSQEIYTKVRASFENIVLIGMPGVGKSTVGRRLEKELGMTLIDTDSEIVSRENRKISDIFATEGEQYFRDVESAVVKEVAAKKNVVIATGGGAILREENVDALKAYGTLFLLDRPLEALLPTDNRPLANDADKIKKLYTERMPIYNKIADVIIKGENGVSSEVNEIKRYMNEH